MNWLEVLAGKVDLSAVPKEQQEILRSFMAKFFRKYIPMTSDTAVTKKEKVDVIAKSLPTMMNFIS